MNIQNNAKKDISELESLVKDFYPYAKKQLGFDKRPELVFNSDIENAKKTLGKTGYYNPSTYTIVIYVDKRHPKDILRSFSHELVHHSQNCEGKLAGDIAAEEGYAQNNTHLRNMEKEAYLQGNIIFRDWEDTRKMAMQETNYNNGRNDIMSLMTERNKKLSAALAKKFNLNNFNLAEERGGASWHDDYKTELITYDEEEKDDDEEEVEEQEEHPMSPASKLAHNPSNREKEVSESVDIKEIIEEAVLEFLEDIKEEQPGEQEMKQDKIAPPEKGDVKNGYDKLVKAGFSPEEAKSLLQYFVKDLQEVEDEPVENPEEAEFEKDTPYPGRKELEDYGEHPGLGKGLEPAYNRDEEEELNGFPEEEHEPLSEWHNKEIYTKLKKLWTK